MTDRIHFPLLKRRQQYKSGQEYRSYREEIREDCLGRCVYCDMHENEIGGKDTMTLDHFRPKSVFVKLTHDPTNLVWACEECNRNKTDNWPAGNGQNTIVGEQGFIDAFQVDREHYFRVLDYGKLDALQSPAAYMMIILELNRQKLVEIRRCRIAIFLCLLQDIEEWTQLLQDDELDAQERDFCRKMLREAQDQWSILVKERFALS